MKTNRYIGLTYMKAEWVAIGTAFLMPLVFWPANPQPFSFAKDWLLVVWVPAGLAVVCATGRIRRKLPPGVTVALAIWVIALSISAGAGDAVSFYELLRNLLACASLPLLLWIEASPRKLVLALIVSGTLVAVVALLQWVNLDPFLLLNLTSSLQGNSRIRIFATFGNPNFVAAWLAAILPLTVFLPAGSGELRSGWRILQIAAGLLQIAAIFATGSRAPILGFVVSGVWLLFCRGGRNLRWILPTLAFCILLLWFSPARSLEKTISGRVYIWRIALSHAAQIPLTGFGPGAFSLRYAQWETDHIRQNPKGPDVVFFGFQDHAHNDYVEFLVDYGVIGLCAFFTVIGIATPLLFRRPQSSLERGIGASFIILLAVAAVDFPLHRPAEVYLFWTQLALLWILVDRQTHDVMLKQKL
jgi:putative inorganic carbon (hco3(-)) transporter